VASPVPDRYIEARIEVPNGLVEIVCDFIIEHIASGIVLEEEEDAPRTGIIFYVPDDNTTFRSELEAFLAGQRETTSNEVPEIKQKQVDSADWLDKYRESIELVRIAEDLIVRPVWIEATDDRFQLILEPKMAFGTGSHATTRSCLRVIRERFRSGMRFLDMGCGSGVLSLLADQMGATYIKAVDYDLAAVANCRENFEINRVNAKHEIIAGSIEKCRGDEPYAFVSANIIRSTILAMLDDLLTVTQPGGVLVLSGLLEIDDAPVLEALAEREQHEVEVIKDEQWYTLVVRKR
jgi:ribosomal protein L11 methyltransferase